jgi:predicted enzyme related to lactoylglutathione lyase
MPRAEHFEISANEPEKAAAFYENVFGWKVTKRGGPVEY